MSNFRTSLLATATALALLSAPVAFAQSTHTQHQTNTQATTADKAVSDSRATGSDQWGTAQTGTSTGVATGTQTGTMGTQTNLSANAGGQKSWDDLDTDRDGNITQAEAALEPALVVIFADIDGDASGSLSSDEYRSYAERASAEGNSSAGAMSDRAATDMGRATGVAGQSGTAMTGTATDTSTGVQSATAGQATTSTNAGGQKSWADIDTDQDGNISKTEAAAMPALDRVFADADGDADGSLTADEYRSYAERASAEGTTEADAGVEAGVSADGDVDVDANADVDADAGADDDNK